MLSGDGGRAPLAPLLAPFLITGYAIYYYATCPLITRHMPIGVNDEWYVRMVFLGGHPDNN